MSNVTELPDSMRRQWRVYAAGLRKHFASIGASPEAIEHAVAVMEPIYLQAARPKAFTGSRDTLVDELNEWVHHQVLTLMFYVAERDIELYHLRGPPAAPTKN